MDQDSSCSPAEVLFDAICGISKTITSQIAATPNQAVKKALTAGFYTAAVAIITDFHRNSPDDMTANLFGGLGNSLLKLGRYGEAEAACQAAIRLDPKDADAYPTLGCALIEQGRYGEAEDALRTAIELDPDCAAAHNNLGYTLNQLDRDDEAVEAYQTAIRLNPENASTHSNLQCTLIKLGRYSEAVEACKTAIELVPNNPAIYTNLGHAQSQLGLHHEAVETCQTAIRLDPTLPYPHRLLAEVNLRRHPAATDAALSHLKDAFDRAGRDTKEPFLFNLYEIIKEFSSPVEAQKTLRQWSRPQDMAPV